MAQVCSKKETNYIYWTAWSSLLGGSIQYFYYNTPGMAYATYSVFLTSLLYWRNPTYGWRRNLDMTTVGCALMYYIANSYGNPNAGWYYGFTSLGVASFLVSWLYHIQGKTLEGAYCHCMVHIFANMGNLALSAGTVVPLLLE